MEKPEKCEVKMFFSQGCPLCGGTVYDGTTTFTVDKESVLIIVRHVPANVCQQCGEAWIKDNMAHELEQIVTEAKTKKRQLEVIDMAA
jgi:YgiT-type zinc finger domain-containing protein